MKLGGLVPALVTPFDREGGVNFEELKKLVRTLLDEGADGFYVTGSTGECFLLTDEERIKIASVVAETTDGKSVNRLTELSCYFRLRSCISSHFIMILSLRRL